jgi:hypothetical protein
MTSKNVTKNEPVDLPEPGPGKQDPKELDKQLDRALEDTMEASDPPATTQPDVRIRHGNSGDKHQGKEPPAR